MAKAAWQGAAGSDGKRKPDGVASGWVWILREQKNPNLVDRHLERPTHQLWRGRNLRKDWSKVNLDAFEQRSLSGEGDLPRLVHLLEEHAL
jgi:hypothetical protein